MAALPLHPAPFCLSSRVPCPMSSQVPRGISPSHAQRPNTQPFPVGAAPVAARSVIPRPQCHSERCAAEPRNLVSLAPSLSRCSREGGNPSPPSYPHLSFRVPRGISSPTPPLFPRRRESIPSSLPLMPNPIPQPYPPPKVPSPLMGEG